MIWNEVIRKQLGDKFGDYKIIARFNGFSENLPVNKFLGKYRMHDNAYMVLAGNGNKIHSKFPRHYNGNATKQNYGQRESNTKLFASVYGDSGSEGYRAVLEKQRISIKSNSM